MHGLGLGCEYARDRMTFIVFRVWLGLGSRRIVRSSSVKNEWTSDPGAIGLTLIEYFGYGSVFRGHGHYLESMVTTPPGEEYRW